MSCSIRDASLTTSRRRQLALYAWRNSAIVGNPEQTSGNSGQQSGPSANIPLEAYVGAQLAGQSSIPITTPCGCNSGVTLQGAVKNGVGK